MLGIRENLSPDFIVYQNEKARLVEAIERLKTAPTPRLFWSGSRIITDGDLNVLQSVPDRIAGGGTSRLHLEHATLMSQVKERPRARVMRNVSSHQSASIMSEVLRPFFHSVHT